MTTVFEGEKILVASVNLYVIEGKAWISVIYPCPD